MKKRIFLGILVLLCSIFSSQPLWAQQLESVGNTPLKKEKVDLKLPDPNRAALYSAVLPGLGQAYNKSYWKIPIIYGAAVGLGYAIKYNNNYYQQFREDLLLVHHGKEPVNFGVKDETLLSSRTDYFRRNRDLLYIMGGVLYLLNIAEAHIDAHLQEFRLYNMDVGVKPSLIDSGRPTPGLGVSVKMRMN